MQDAVTLEQLSEAHDSPVFSSDGQMIGDLGAIYYDKETGVPEWIGVETGFIATKRLLVPVRGARVEADGVHIGFTKAQVLATPDIGGDEISEDTERELLAHYGIEHSEPPPEAVEPAPADFVEEPETRTMERVAAVDEAEAILDEPEPEPVAATESGLVPAAPAIDSDHAVTRAEEEIIVGKREVEAGRLRLRKWVETEPVEVEVTLQRETARIRREPITDPSSAPVEIGEAEIELALRAEEPVIRKQTVAKERIVVEKEVETELERISDEVRKERVEIEGDNVDLDG